MAVGDTYVFPSFLTTVLTKISFQSRRLLFLHASAEVSGENTPERNFDSTGSRTHNHQINSPTRSPLSHLGGATVSLSLYQTTETLDKSKFKALAYEKNNRDSNTEICIGKGRMLCVSQMLKIGIVYRWVKQSCRVYHIFFVVYNQQDEELK